MHQAPRNTSIIPSQSANGQTPSISVVSIIPTLVIFLSIAASIIATMLNFHVIIDLGLSALLPTTPAPVLRTPAFNVIAAGRLLSGHSTPGTHPHLARIFGVKTAGLALEIAEFRWRTSSTNTLEVLLCVSTSSAPGIDPLSLLINGILEVANSVDAHPIFSKCSSRRRSATEWA
jgi:hypothetical protein